MPTYKLIYFNGRGRAELSRLIFAQAGQEYEDCRVDKDGWAAIKPDTPFGQLPVLEVDGVKLCQSMAMARYLAKTFGLAGKNDLESALVDVIADCGEDMTQPLISLVHEKDEGRKAEMKKKFEEEQLPESLAKLEKMLKGDYFVGDEMTWADIAIAQSLTWPAMAGVTVNYDKIPKLKALKDRVESSPKIAAWIAKRPESPF